MNTKLNIKATNMELTAAIKNYVEKKFSTISKGLSKFQGKGDREIKAQIEVGKTTRHHEHGKIFRAEINLNLSGKKYRTESKEEDLYSAIDKAHAEMHRKVVDCHKRDITTSRKAGSKVKKMIRGTNGK